MKKFSRNKKGPRPHIGSRHVDEDGDAVMDGPGSHKEGFRSSSSRGTGSSRGRFPSLVNRFKPSMNQRRLNNVAGRDPNELKLMFRGSRQDWFRILVPNGRRYGQEFILRELTTRCPVEFKAMNFHLDQQCATFYINSWKASQEFRKLSGTITTEQGTKMNIIVRPCDLPQVTLTEVAENAIKVAMSNRYDTATRFLNLSKLEADNNLVEAGFFLPLSRVNITNFVVAVITDHIPEIEGLDLSNNLLYSISCLAPLAVKCKDLKILKLAGNKIRNVKDLDALKGLPVTEATFAGCPFTERYKEEDAYVSAVRERFPRVVVLDQKQLPPPIVFDLEEERIAVPRSLPSHLPADQTRALVVGFVEQFFACFDGEDRSPLIDAYHEAAMFSLSSTTLCNSRCGKDREKLDYKGESRNFLRMQHDGDLKRRLLRQGRINIIDYMKTFAKTKHDPSSFIVDVSFIQPTLMLFHVNGVFREKRPDGRFLPNLRSFHRTFAVVPQGVGLAIVNEEWFITVATDKQARAYQEPSPPSRPPSPAAGTAMAAAGTVPPVTPANEAILAKFMEVTKMNRKFSMDCLVQHNWNPEAAYEVFVLLQQNGKLPPEAFI